MSVQQSDLSDPALVAEVDLARAAAQEEAGDERVGDYVEYHLEDEAAVTHLFEADKPGYQGWRWAVTITSAGPSTDVTVSEVVLLPGPTALVAPEWIPWQNRVQAGDLGVGDLLPTSPDDPRLVPAYLESDDPAVEEAATEAGLGRVRVMSRPARLDAADRWLQSDFGPRSDMARGAPAHCGTCGFYLPLAGSLRAAFGSCGNEMSPADGHVVHAEYGCGAHSEAEVEQVSPVLVADLIYDDAQLDVEPLEVVDEVPAVADEPSAAAEDLTPAESAEDATESVDATAAPPVAEVESAADRETPDGEPSVAGSEIESDVVVDAEPSAEVASVAGPGDEPASSAEPEVAPVAATPEPVAPEVESDVVDVDPPVAGSGDEAASPVEDASVAESVSEAESEESSAEGVAPVADGPAEDAAPAGVEPVTTAESADESTHRE